MKKLEENKKLYMLALCFSTAAIGCVIYPLFDWIISLITNSDFKYNIEDHVISPIVFGITFGIVYTIIIFKKKGK